MFMYVCLYNRHSFVSLDFPLPQTNHFSLRYPFIVNPNPPLSRDGWEFSMFIKAPSSHTSGMYVCYPLSVCASVSISLCAMFVFLPRSEANCGCSLGSYICIYVCMYICDNICRRPGCERDHHRPA